MHTALAIAAPTPNQAEPSEPIRVSFLGKELERALQLMALATPKRSPIHALQKILLSVRPGGIYLQATDGNIQAEALVGGQVSNRESSLNALVQADLLRKALRNVNAGLLEFTHGSLSVGPVSIPLEDAADYPAFNTPLAKVVARLELDDLKKVAFAMSTDTTRASLRGCLLVSHQGKQRLVTTDGHRLALIDTGRDFTGPQMILPREALDVLCKLKVETFLVGTSQERVVFLIPGMGSLSCQFTAGEFPDYRCVIPRNQPGTLVVQRQAMLRALEDLSPITRGQKPPVIVFEVGAEGMPLRISANGHDGSASARVPVSETVGLSKLAGGFGLNPNYLKDVLSVLDSETVRIGFTDPKSPFRIEAGKETVSSTVNVLMPCRV